MKNNFKFFLGIVGLGYVGLPLAIEFSKKKKVIAYDINKKKIQKLKKKNKSRKIIYTSDEKKIKKCNIIIVAVPTPINNLKLPDLSFLKKACITIARNLSKNTIIIFESTVYPGCTEEFCMPLIEKISKLKVNQDIFYGYSPERINPGDKSHELTKIDKLVCGSNSVISQTIKKLYKSIISKKVHITESIKIAEAAKIIENTQRDLNIALINEFAIILGKLNIDTIKVIKAASTKWNFHSFSPGLVGGHCVGVDPYYLTYKAKKIGINPKVILAGREINDNMGRYIFSEIKKISEKKNINLNKSKILILGFAFKENCDDIRNTRVIDIVNCFKHYHSKIDIYDPLIDQMLLKDMYELKKIKKLKKNFYDIIICCVPHRKIQSIGFKRLISCAKINNVFYDVKSAFSSHKTDGRL
jgi:UDP-N-acetyl-D-galactosamine dehydrogenase